MIYTMTTNNDSLTSNNLDTIKGWLLSDNEVTNWELIYDGKKLAAKGLNCLNEFSECLIIYPLGRG